MEGITYSAAAEFLVVVAQGFHASDYFKNRAKGNQDVTPPDMPSETVPTAPDVPTASAVPPLKLNKYKFQRERLPIKKLDYAIEEVNEMLQATNIQMNKIRHIANHGGYTFNSLAGDLITQTAE